MTEVPHNPMPMIDGMPPVSPALAGPGRVPHVFERIDGIMVAGYEFNPDHAVATHEDMQRTMLKNLSDTLQFGSPTEHNRLVENAYAVTRQIGDMTVASTSPVAFAVLDATRSMAAYDTTFSVGSTEAGHVDTFRDATETVRHHMAIGIDQVYQKGTSRRTVESRLAAAGVEVAGKDVSLLLFLHITAHEAGHVIQNGINKYLPVTTNEKGIADIDVDAAAKQVLIDEPSIGQTGNFATDARIHNERFAEGYGLLVMSRAAELLGYDPATVTALVDATSNDPEVYASLRHIHEVTAETDLRTVLKDKNPDAYHGELGYTMPLRPSELIKNLELFDNLLRTSSAELPDTAAYNAARDAQVSERTIEVIAESEQNSRLSRRQRMVAVLAGRRK